MARHHNEDGSRAAGPAVVKLSPAEATVVAQVSRGLTNPEIAAVLGKSEATVKNQLASVYRKLGVHNRIRLMMLFRS